MYKYYVRTNTEKDGQHEIHLSDCAWLPKQSLRKSLGEHSSCVSAIVTAESLGFKPATGCEHCSPLCKEKE